MIVQLCAAAEVLIDEAADARGPVREAHHPAPQQGPSFRITGREKRLYPGQPVIQASSMQVM